MSPHQEHDEVVLVGAVLASIAGLELAVEVDSAVVGQRIAEAELGIVAEVVELDTVVVGQLVELVGLDIVVDEAHSALIAASLVAVAHTAERGELVEVQLVVEVLKPSISLDHLISY